MTHLSRTIKLTFTLGIFVSTSFGQTDRRRSVDFDIRSLSGQGQAGLAGRVLVPKPGQSNRQAAGPVDAEAMAREFLRENGQTSLRLARMIPAGASTVVEFDQAIGGIPVFEGRVKVVIGATGGVIAAAVAAPAPTLLDPLVAEQSASEAITLALRAVGQPAPAGVTPLGSIAGMEAFANPLGGGLRPILASLVAFPVDGRTARLGWRILAEVDRAHSYEMVVDAGTGRMMLVHNLVRRAGSARVWKVSPLKGDRDLVSLPDAWLAPSIQVTTGNNADVYLDTTGDDQPDVLPDNGIRSGRAFSQSQIFDFPAPTLTTGDPRTFRAAAVTNAFYFANLAHDYFYGLGFDEVSGNFQTDNGGKGGKGGDAVLVEVQDRYEVDNSGFAPTPEGVAPRMQLGIVPYGARTEADDRDYAYDGQTVIHEYSHGVASRLVGGGTATSCLAGTQSMALDEGWADYFSSSYFNDPVQSAYLVQDVARGQRRQSFEGYTFTYEDLGNEGFEEHNDGEIWTATLWDLRKTLNAALVDRLVLEGLRLTPCRPSFIDARDAILAADKALNNGANRSAIYTVFARHGMGASAGGFDGNLDTFTVFNAAFDLPPDLRQGNLSPTVTSRPSGFAVNGEQFQYQIQAADPDGGRLLFELSEGPQGMTVDSATGMVRWATTFASQRVKIAITDGQGGRVIHGIRIVVLTPLRPGVPATISEKTGVGMATIQVPADTPVLQVTLRGGKGDADIALMSPDFFFDFGSPRTGQIETVSVGLPIPGLWIISIFPYTAFEDVQLTASFPQPKLLTGNETLGGLTGERSSETFYKLVVPPGTTGFGITISGGSGDVDVTVARRMPPFCQVFEEYYDSRCWWDANYASFAFGNREAVNVQGPEPGDWYINLTSASGYFGASMAMRMTVRPTLVATASSLSFESVIGGTAPAAQTVRITDPSGSQFAWTATPSADSAWLKLDKTSGTGNATLSVSVDPTELAGGTYTATISITGAGLSGSPHTVTVTLKVVTPPGIAVSAASLSFQDAPGVNPAVQRLAVTNTGTGTLAWTATVATASGGEWLAVDQPRGTGNVNLQVVVTAGSRAVGVYEGTVTIAAAGATSVTVPVRYTVAVPFVVAESSLRSVASMRKGYPVSPGEMMMLEGSNFTDACSLEAGAAVLCPQAAGYPLPVLLGGIRVAVNDVDAPMLLVLPGQVRFLIPFELQGTQARIVVIRQGAPAAAVVRDIALQNIGVFSLPGDGTGAGHIYHADGSLVTAEAPLQPEETFTVLAGGLGAVEPKVASGAAGPDSPRAVIVTPIRAFLSGGEGTVVSAHLAPGLAGFYHVQITAPASLSLPYPTLVLQSAVSTGNEVTVGWAP